jgi:transposase
LSATGLGCSAFASVEPVSLLVIRPNGNQRLNRARHILAPIQARTHPRGCAYLDRRRAEGKTKRQAVRALKNQLSNMIYRRKGTGKKRA